MKDLTHAVLAPFGSRFLVIGFLPLAGATAFLLVLVWAGAPTGPLDLRDAWQTVLAVTPAQVAVIVAAVLLGSVLAQPLQLLLVRAIEGAWPLWWGSGLARRWQLRRHRAALARATLVRTPVAAAAAPAPSGDEIRAVAPALVRFVRSFPDDESDVRPTALGNALAALERRAGRGHGIDAPVLWPRLYPLLTGEVRRLVDDRRNALDLNERLAVTNALLTVVTVVMLVRSGWWLLLALAPAAVAAGAYRGAVRAAVLFGEAVAVAFDLNRMELIRALRLPLPADSVAERRLFAELCAFWRQNAPVRFDYEHEPPVAPAACWAHPCQTTGQDAVG